MQNVEKVISHRSDQPSLAFGLLKTFIKSSITQGQFRIIDVHGGVHDFGDGEGKRVAIKFHHPSTYWKLLINPDLHFGEAYVDGDISIVEGNIQELLDLVLKNINKTTKMSLNRLHNYLTNFGSLNTLFKAKENVGHHYDLSYELYKLFLDKEMQYSCAYFTSDHESLELAQQNKLNLITKKLLVEPHHHVLDIGCGWGGLALHIARTTGATVTGITLSKEQLSYARNKAIEAGLEEQVSFELLDYRKIKGIYNRIVSVGMFEHVGVEYYPKFFEIVHEHLTSDGVALIHSIGKNANPHLTNPWIKKYIFPGGHIPSLSEVIPAVEKSELILTDIEILREHYAKTINEWTQRFKKNRAKVRSIYDERFCRMWEFYLAASEASFKYAGNMVFQLQLSKSQLNVPITRNYLNYI